MQLLALPAIRACAALDSHIGPTSKRTLDHLAPGQTFLAAFGESFRLRLQSKSQMVDGQRRSPQPPMSRMSCSRRWFVKGVPSVPSCQGLGHKVLAEFHTNRITWHRIGRSTWKAEEPLPRPSHWSPSHYPPGPIARRCAPWMSSFDQLIRTSTPFRSIVSK